MLNSKLSVFWGTATGQALTKKASRLGEQVMDVASSAAARQCCVDASVFLIKLLEALHTPEVKSLLEQFAVSACRAVDVLSSGRAKQVWFEVSEVAWALIEVGSDPSMVAALAEWCAQVCFALEKEHEHLKHAEGDRKRGRLATSQRRRERDARQMATYPPGKRVVSEDGGRASVEEALLDGLNSEIDKQEKQREADNPPYDTMFDDDGPPQVIVSRNSSENIEKGAPIAKNPDEAVGPIIVENDDDKSDITTDIEDLRNDKDHEDMGTQSSASDKLPGYDPDGKVDHTNIIMPQNPGDHVDSRCDVTATTECHNNIDASLIQFYRRLNEVLAESRKHGEFIDRPPSTQGSTPHTRGGNRSKTNVHATRSAATDRERNSPPRAEAIVARRLLGKHMKRWKLIVITSILCGVAALCMLWFALGCYGFYVLVVRERHIWRSPFMQPRTPQQPPSVVIQVISSRGQAKDVCDRSADWNECTQRNNGIASITTNDWNKLKLDVDAAIGLTSEEVNI